LATWLTAGLLETLVPEDFNFCEGLVAFLIVPAAVFAMKVFDWDEILNNFNRIQAVRIGNNKDL
jgi:hypothetical protein